MQFCRFMIAMALLQTISSLAMASPRDQRFDTDWRFLLADVQGAQDPDYIDTDWRKLDLPHDWSIEDLPAQAPGNNDRDRIGPFSPAKSQGGLFTGHTVGGVGWYRKHFIVKEPGKHIAVRFDGVYMNAEVWINGHLLGSHPHGYTAFAFDLTPYLNPPGKDNVLAVRVRNVGRNSRWYSGSGIYRHVYLTTTNPIHIPTWGVFITTPNVSTDKARVKVSVEVRNDTTVQQDAEIQVQLLDPDGRAVADTRGDLSLRPDATSTIELPLHVASPKRWSPDSPNLYTAKVSVTVAGQTVDMLAMPFGIRKIEFDAEHGFRLNGQPLLLKGGNVHHDNGPLGSAAIDRAEQRRVELIKANGYNAIRCSHNPPSSAFLSACDRLGMLVIDEAFDQWNEPKENRLEGYQNYFKDWYARDVAAMVRRDRNHPSVIMWSIGNEIPEQFRDHDTPRKLREAVLQHDTTRPVTQAICNDWGEVTKNWDTLSDPAFKYLDVAGYNYLPERYEPDHTRHPDRVMYGAETYPKEALEYWSLVEKHPYVIGDFVWTAMDYLGESGLAHSVLSNEDNPFFMPWPWFNANCGDLDICGFKKPQSFYRDVLWRQSLIEMLVHAPVPAGLTEHVSQWGWPNESKCWNWAGHEGEPIKVSVYSRCDRVRLELNGKPIGEQTVSEATHLTATFNVLYAPGVLRAIGYRHDRPAAQTELTTTGPPHGIQLTADRSVIEASRNDLSFVTVEIVDDAGRRVPDAAVDIHFTVTGVGELEAHANADPKTPASFHGPTRKTFRGRCLAILRPTGGPGKITLHAEAQGLSPATIAIECRDIQHESDH